MYLRNAWYAAGFSDTLDEKGIVSLTMLGEPVVLYRRTDGRVVALENRCAHRFAALHNGRVEGNAIRCMYHGMLYDESGKAIEIPGQDLIPERACIRKYPAAEQSGWLWVWMGDADAANEDLIPPLYGLRNPEWRQPADALDYEANYKLINDNLTDLSHLSYAHETSFRTDLTWAATQPRSFMIDRGVRFERWLPNTAPIPPLGKAAAHPLTDQWVVVDFLVPGIFILYGEIHEQGTAEKMGFKQPQGVEPLFRQYSQQCVTPTGPNTSRYFYAWGPHADYATEEEAHIMRTVLQTAFLEDKLIIEDQQKIIDLDPGRVVLPISADKGVTMFQRLMNRLIREESDNPDAGYGDRQTAAMALAS